MLSFMPRFYILSTACLIFWTIVAFPAAGKAEVPSTQEHAAAKAPSPGAKGGIQDLAKTALKLGQGAGSLAGEASLTAWFTTLKTLRFVGTALRSSMKTFEVLSHAFGSPLNSVAAKPMPNETDGPPPYLAGYSPAEKEVSCKNCDQKTLIRGNLPGRKITCPACGNEIIS